MNTIKNLNHHEDRWLEGNWSEQDLIDFEALKAKIKS